MSQVGSRALLLRAALAVVLCVGQAAHGSSCKPDGQDCRTNQACCSGSCVNGAPPGSKPFGVCCRPTTCAAQGKNCGTIPNGTCPQPLNCGSCTAPDTCGGAGTPNVCGCIPTTCAAQGKDCGTISDGCGGTLDCGGVCAGNDTCGGGGTPNVCGCTPLTCADIGAMCGTIEDGCGHTRDCTPSCMHDADCPETQRCILSRNGNRCEARVRYDRGCKVDEDCLSECCCVLEGGGGGPRGGYGRCTSLSECTSDAAFTTITGDHVWNLTQCPGTACSTDDDCAAATRSHTQFCTGGVCRMKAELGEACAFSAGCGGGDDFNDPPYTIVPACCCLTGASEGVCSFQDTCYRVSGGTCECSVPSQLGGICPGSPCGQDSDCNPDFQFCTSGTCRPKQIGDTPCSFSSACLGAPVGQGCCCSTDGTTGQCKDNHFRCNDIDGTCLP